MRNAAAPLDRVSLYCAEIWGDLRFKQYMGMLYAAVSPSKSKGSEQVFLGASTCTGHDDGSTYHEPNGTWHRYLISCTRTTDVSLLACPPPPSFISYAVAVAGLAPSVSSSHQPFN